MVYLTKFETLSDLNSHSNELEVPNTVCITSDLSTVYYPETVTFTTSWDRPTNNKTKVIIAGDIVLGDKVDCYSITFETGGHLTINAGARLRIWEGGITNSDAETTNYIKLTVDDVNKAYSQLLLHPSVTMNRNPMATTELFTSAYKNGNEFIWQRFGVPAVNGIIRSDIIKTISTNMQYWNITNQAWASIGASQLLEPFVGFAMTNISSTQGSLYQLTCNLICNTNSNITTVNGSIISANSYIALMNVSLLYNIIKKIGATLYIQEILVTDENISNFDNLSPLDSFIINHNTSTTLLLDYKSLVWDTSFEIDEAEASTTRGAKSAPVLMKSSKVDMSLPIFQNPKIDLENAAVFIEDNNNER